MVFETKIAEIVGNTVENGEVDEYGRVKRC